MQNVLPAQVGGKLQPEHTHTDRLNRMKILPIRLVNIQ